MPKEYEYNNFLQKQQKQFDEQDEVVEDISHELTKIKHIAIIIGNEVGEQNVLLDDTNNDINNTNNRLNQTNNKLDKLMNIIKDKHCWYITILIIIIVIMIIIYFA